MPSWNIISGLWTNASNWLDGLPDAPGALAIFGFGSSGVTQNVFFDESSTIEVGTMVIQSNAANLIFKGSTSDTGTGVAELIFSNGASNALLSVDVASGGTIPLFLGTDGLRMRLLSNLQVDIVNLGSSTVFDLPVVGTGKLIKTGSGVLDLRGSNSFSGGIDLLGGTLLASGDAALGTGAITLGNNALYRSVGAIDNVIATQAGLYGTAGSGQIAAATGQIIDLTGQLQHLSNGTLAFGAATLAGTVVARLSGFAGNPAGSHYAINAGTLAFANQFNAENLFNQPGTGTTTIASGATLNTNGFFAEITNLRLDGGTIRAAAATLDLTVVDNSPLSHRQQGTIQGTAGADSFVASILHDFDLFGLNFTSWNPAADVILLIGSALSNGIAGSSTNDEIYGLGGDDFLSGGGGVDLIFADTGDDQVALTDNSDGSSVFGGSGNDILYIDSGLVTLSAITGFERLFFLNGSTLQLTGAQFSAGFDPFSVLTAAISEGTVIVNMGATTSFNARGMTVVGPTSVAFEINGSAANDTIKTSLETRATINTGNGSNVVQASNLNDVITGGTGIDKIAGNGGIDIMTGGTGADVFKFRKITDSGLGFGADQINDFVSGTDKLNFSRIDTNAAVAGDQAFAYIGTAAFSATGTAQIRWTDIGATLLVQADLNGDGTSDMDVLLLGAGAGVLTASDFVL